MNLLSATGVSHDYPHHGRVLHAIHLAIARRNGGPARTQRLWEKHRRGCWWVWKRRSTVILRRALTALKGEAIGAFRRDIQLVFQDAFSAVNPRKTVRGSSASRCAICCACRVRRVRGGGKMLLAVDLAPSLLDKRPAQLSGGQLQRVCGTRRRYGRSC